MYKIGGKWSFSCIRLGIIRSRTFIGAKMEAFLNSHLVVGLLAHLSACSARENAQDRLRRWRRERPPVQTKVWPPTSLEKWEIIKLLRPTLESIDVDHFLALPGGNPGQVWNLASSQPLTTCVVVLSRGAWPQNKSGPTIFLIYGRLPLLLQKFLSLLSLSPLPPLSLFPQGGKGDKWKGLAWAGRRRDQNKSGETEFGALAHKQTNKQTNKQGPQWSQARSIRCWQNLGCKVEKSA